MENQESIVGEETAEPPDERKELDFPVELKCPVLLFKPKLPGHSHLYSALDNLTQHRVAIKRISINRQSDQFKVLSVIREIRALRGLEHESVVKFLDVKINPTNVFIVQELMDADLDCVLENTRNLGMEHTRLFSYQLLRAIKFIHSAFIIHRDIQLTNVLVNVDTLMLKVGDFGSSRIVDNRQETRLLSLPASFRAYHAPEILRGRRDYSFPSDIFSCGVVFFAMTFGADCYDVTEDLIDSWKKRLADMDPTDDPAWDVILTSSLQLNPDKRATLDQLLSSSFFDIFSDGGLERIASKRRFHVEDEIFDMCAIYDELLASVKSCRPDEEVSSATSGLKPNSSIRSFVDVSSTCELSTVSEHEARILQTDSEFGIQIYDGSDKKDRMFYEDHQAELGVSFDPYKWDRKTHFIKEIDSGYQSGEIKSYCTQSNSPDIRKVRSLTPASIRDLELEIEANRHHFEHHFHQAANNHRYVPRSFYKHSHKHKHKHKKRHHDPSSSKH